MLGSAGLPSTIEALASFAGETSLVDAESLVVSSARAVSRLLG